MIGFKTKILAATMIAGVATAANAQFAFPNVELRGVGASAVGDIQVKVQNCIGVNNELGTNSGTFTNVTEADYTPTPTAATNPSLICSVDDANGNIYNSVTPSNFNGKYVSTGSGFGRQSWRRFVSQFTGAASSQNAFTQGTGAFVFANEWENVQFAFSEAPASVGDITDYNTDDTRNTAMADGVTRDLDVSAQTEAGNAIQIPFYIVPVAFAYNNQYGTKAGVALNFRARFPQNINGVAAGGIRMNRTDYCEIWNGSITNWNDNKLFLRNGSQSLGALVTGVVDDVARFNTEGVPIRLVGRADRSGTTDLFTRALAAQCGTTVPNGGSNKYEKAAESLPFVSVTGGLDLTGFRADTNYKPGVSSGSFAGVTQSLNGLGYDRTNDRICTSVEANVAGAGCPGTTVDQNAVNSAAYFDLFNTGAAKGLFMVADGNPGVEEAVRRQDVINSFLVSKVDASVQLNGKLGYAAGDFVAGSAGRSLFSAALQVNGIGASYAMPSAQQAGFAFGTIKAPQASSTGAYAADTRTILVDLTNPSAGTTTAVSRANPLHWVNVLYPTADSAGPVQSLDRPVKGYPVTGASNLLTYTCFDSVAKRSGMTNFIGYTIGKVTKKNAIGGVPATINLSANTFKGTGATSLGILSKSNIAGLPAGWGNAVNETFLKKSTQALAGVQLGTLNLWIQDKQAATVTLLDGIGTNDVRSNPVCAVANGLTTPGAVPGA